MALDLPGRGRVAVVELEDVEEGLELFGDGKEDELAVCVAVDGDGYSVFLAYGALDNPIPRRIDGGALRGGRLSCMRLKCSQLCRECRCRRSPGKRVKPRVFLVGGSTQW